MTVSYSSIEEAWGNSYLSPQLQSSISALDPTTGGMKRYKKSKKSRRNGTSTTQPPLDPLCELYNMGSQKAEEDPDLADFANMYFAKNEKPLYKSRIDEPEGGMKKAREMDEVLISSRTSEPSEEYDVVRGVPVGSTRIMKYDPTQEYDSEGEYMDEEEERTVVSRNNVTDPVNRYYGRAPTGSRALKPESAYTKMYVPETEQEQKSDTFVIYDIALYIISGIILIFILEQFVYMGTMLGLMLRGAASVA